MLTGYENIIYILSPSTQRQVKNTGFLG